MRYARTVLLLAVMTALCIGIFAAAGSRRYTPDIVLQNDISETVKENMSDLGILAEEYPGTEILVFNSEGFCIYPDDSTVTLTDARAGGVLCLPITDGSKFLGTAAIPDPAFAEYDLAYRRLLISAIALLTVMIAAAVIYFIFVRKTIIKPFREMKEFAGSIAMGQLDTPLEMNRSNLFGAFTESFDIMREELKASQTRENELKLKEKELVAALSHDLKTPITGINIICDVLSVKTDDEYVLGKVSSIQKKTRQMELLVSDLLTTALDDLGEISVSCSDVSSAVLRDIVRAADPRSLVREDPPPECMIHIDEKRMQQVIGNIIGNSYKYADTPIDVTFAISGDYLKMSIADHGRGVPADELDLITNKFYRGSGVKDSGTEGSGLGLYIASTLMAKMNGELICSGKGEGLTVTLMILLS